ncbi:UNVERIFIED_CONTAM: hypothetical protein Sradi_0262700 [Sesamum radiatum]|uniref:Uncharacterized protein n=1 Tax=Sesamum radiatum TaxID=300843 RepID=A0AAW2W2C3_SESRA
MFHFADEDVSNQSSVAEEQNVDCQPTISSHLPDPPGESLFCISSSIVLGGTGVDRKFQLGVWINQAKLVFSATVADYPLEEAARNYVNSFHMDGGEPVQEYSYQEPEPEPELETDQLDPEPEIETVAVAVVGRLAEETPTEESSPFPQSAVTTPQEPQPSAQEPVAEPGKLTYASILRAKGKPPSSFISPPAITRTAPPAADRNHISQPSRQQSAPTSPNSRGYAGEGALPLKEGDLKSVYVRNLPSTVTSLDVLQEFKSFGNINSDGVFLRNRMVELLSNYLNEYHLCICGTSNLLEVDRILVYALRLLSLKMFSLLRMQSRESLFGYRYILQQIYELFHIVPVIDRIRIKGVLESIVPCLQLIASPIQFAGRRVYIEQRKPNPVASRGGRNGARGGGGRGGRASGRGSDRNGIRSNSLRGT